MDRVSVEWQHAADLHHLVDPSRRHSGRPRHGDHLPSADRVHSTLNPTITVQTGAAPVPSGSETITGPPQFNTTQQAAIPTFTTGISSINCAWQYKSGSTWRAVSGGTSCNYIPVAADVGRLLRVVLTTVAPGYATREIIETEPSVIAPLQLANTVIPGIFGNTLSGEMVTAGNGTWSTPPTSFSYRWLYSATGLPPYTTAPGVSNQVSYMIPQSLLGQTLVVQVTASRSGYANKTVTNSAGTVNRGELTILTLPKSTLTGTVATGEILHFSGATFSPAPNGSPALDYDVYVYDTNDTLVASGTANPYPIPSAYVHDYIEVQAGGFNTAYPSPAWTNLVLAKKGDNIPSGTLSIGGDAVGSPITSGGVTWSVAASTVTYQWQYKSGSSWVSIAGATGSAFTPTSAYLAHTLRLVETATATNYNTASVISTNTETVAVAAAPTAGSGSSAPTITGGNIVGDTLTVSPGIWSVPGTTFSYQWQTSPDGSTWTNIAGATANHVVVPQSAYLGSDYLGVLVKASKAGYAQGSFEAVTTGLAGEGEVSLVTSPVVTSSHGKLTVSNGTWRNATSFSYTWYSMTPSGGGGVVGTLNNYTPGVSDVGNAIYAVVAASAPNYLGLNKTLLARSGGPITPDTPIAVGGTPVTDGGTLTADWTFFSVTTATVTYQWYRSGVAISGATSQNYSPVAADIGKVLSVTLTVSAPGWTTEKYRAASTVTQSGIGVDDSTDPTISGSPVVDGVLSVVGPVWDETGVTVTYQWVTGGAAIPGATGKTYTVRADDLGNDIWVEVTGSHPYQAPDADQTGPVTILPGVPLTATSPAKVTGVVGFGKVLTATSGIWNFPATVTYQWQYIPLLGSTWNDIPGATASTYTPAIADGLAADGDLRVLITATRAGHPPTTLTSAAVTIP